MPFILDKDTSNKTLITYQDIFLKCMFEVISTPLKQNYEHTHEICTIRKFRLLGCNYFLVQ